MTDIIHADWKSRTGRYFQIINVGTGLALALLVIGLAGLKSANYWVGALLTLILLWAAIKKPVDEFARDCWNMGAQWSFFMIIASLTLLPAVAGFYDGITGAQLGTSKAYQNQMLQLLPGLCVFAFFAGFQWRRVRGG